MAGRKIVNLRIEDGCTMLHDVESPQEIGRLPPKLTDDVNICVCGRLEDSDARKLSAFAPRFKNVTICIWACPSSDYTLQFLDHFPFLHDFRLLDRDFSDEEELNHLPVNLRSLYLAGGRQKSISLGFLARLRNLRSLFLEEATKQIESVGRLKDLRELTLRSVTLPGLEILLPLTKLQSLDIKLGGTNELDLIPNLGRLRYLELWKIRGLTDLSWLADVRTLQYLWLQSLGHVKSLPSLKRLRQLRRVHLEALKGLTDLSQVAAAPNLEDLRVSDMRHLSTEDFRPFVGHKSLRRTSIALGSKKRDSAVDVVLPFPPVQYPFHFK